MTPCLRPDEIIDVVDGTADGDATAHVETCPRCRAAVSDVRSALAAAQDADVPEPSPLFWSQINARVRTAIDDGGPAAGTGWWAWLRWDVVVPLAGLATIVVALTSAIGREPALVAPVPAADGVVAVDDAAPVAGEPGRTDGALELMLDLVATLPESEWDTLGLATLPDLGVAAQALSADEQQALGAILRAAVERPQS